MSGDVIQGPLTDLSASSRTEPTLDHIPAVLLE